MYKDIQKQSSKIFSPLCNIILYSIIQLSHKHSVFFINSMSFASSPSLNISPLITTTSDSNPTVYGSSRVYPTTTSTRRSISKRCNWVMQREPSVGVEKKPLVVYCTTLEVGDDLDTEACELVNGSELEIGEGSVTIRAYLFKAVKNNNGIGILLLSDIFGFEDSSTRDFAYRVACNGYNVLVPDLFRGDPWSRSRPKHLFEQWLAKQEPSRVAEDIAASTEWMVEEFTAAGIPRKVGVIGFCYGGGRVLEVLARDQNSNFGTGVSFYGTRMDRSAAENVNVPVLFITGDDDPLCPVPAVDEFEKTIGRNSKVVVFKGRGHGFVHRPQSPEEDQDADEAFTIMRNWLYNHLLHSHQK